MSATFGGNVIVSAPNQDRVMLNSVHIHLIFEHLFYEYFVRRSINQAAKGMNKETWLSKSVSPCVSSSDQWSFGPFFINKLLYLFHFSILKEKQLCYLWMHPCLYKHNYMCNPPLYHQIHLLCHLQGFMTVLNSKPYFETSQIKFNV